MSSLDKAIKYSFNKAVENYRQAMICNANHNDDEKDRYNECGSQYQQLAQWLVELKSYRYGGIIEDVYTKGYRKAITDFVDKMIIMLPDNKEDILQIAEQLEGSVERRKINKDKGRE